MFDTFDGRTTLFGIVSFVPAFLFILAFFLLPIAYVIYMSFLNAPLFSLETTWVGLQNYTQIFADSLYWASLKKGAIFALGSVALQMVLGIGFALALNQLKRKYFRSVAITLAIIPYLIPTVIMALMWKWLLHPLHGVLNAYAVSFGLIPEPIDFFASVDLAMPMVVLANSWKFTAFVVLLVLARLQSIDEALYEQAKISGANLFQMFRTVTLPQLRSVILIVILLRVIWMFNKFDVVWLLTRGGPLEATYTLPVYIYETVFSGYHMGVGAAASVTLFILLSVFGVLYFWLLQPSSELGTRR